MMVMIVIMVMMTVTMLMMVGMFLRVAVQMRLAARQPRVLAEHQRFDHYRHGHRRQPDAAEVDIIEVPEHDAIDTQDFALDIEFLAQDRAESLRHVAVEHDVERLLFRDGLRHSAHDALRKRKDAFM